jgi:dipeptidyl aminopeptidase/acylaminoacyl peptidase
MDTGGNERTQLYLLRGVAGNTDHGLGDGWESVPLAHDPKAIHTFGGWSPDGTHIAFSANREDPSRFDAHTLKVGDREPKLIAKGPGGYYSVVGWSPDGKSVLLFRMESNFNHDLYVAESAGGKVRHLTPHEGNAQYDSPRWSADGKTVWCASTQGRDLASLAAIDVATGKLSYVGPESKHEVEGVLPSPKGKSLLVTLNVDGKTELQLRKPDGQPDATIGLPLGTTGGAEFAPDDGRLTFTFDGPRHNPDVWVMPLAGDRKPAGQLTHVGRAGLPVSQFVEPELIKYPTFDGLEIPAWFYKPAAKGDRLPPVIVYPHGGPESQTRPSFNALFQYFLAAGYAILAPNVRGSSGYGTRYMNLDNVRNRMDSVKDLAHAADWLAEKKQGDPKRLAVFGGSYGGFMVLAQVTNFPDKWAAGIDVVGICNFVTFLENTGAYRRAHRESEYGSLEKDRDFLVSISPIHKVDRIKCPMMVIHGANDPRAPVGEAEQVVAALKQRNVPVEYLRYEDEGHGLAKLKNRLDAYPKMVAFLDKYLK